MTYDEAKQEIATKQNCRTWADLMYLSCSEERREFYRQKAAELLANRCVQELKWLMVGSVQEEFLQELFCEARHYDVVYGFDDIKDYKPPFSE